MGNTIRTLFGDIPEIDVAWAAGAFDGEGYVGVARVKGVEKLRVTVNNTDPGFVRPFKDWFGGSFHRVNASRYNPRARDRWVWEVAGKTAAGVLSILLPYLRIKRPQAVLAIEYASTLRQGATPTPEVVARRAEIDAALRAEKVKIHG